MVAGVMGAERRARENRVWLELRRKKEGKYRGIVVSLILGGRGSDSGIDRGSGGRKAASLD